MQTLLKDHLVQQARYESTSSPGYLLGKCMAIEKTVHVHAIYVIIYPIPTDWYWSYKYALIYSYRLVLEDDSTDDPMSSLLVGEISKNAPILVRPLRPTLHHVCYMYYACSTVLVPLQFGAKKKGTAEEGTQVGERN